MTMQGCFAALAAAVSQASNLPAAWAGDNFTPTAGQPWLQVWSLSTIMRGSGDADLSSFLVQVDINCPLDFGDAKILAYADGILSVMREKATFSAQGQQICIQRRSVSPIMRDAGWRKLALTIKYTAAVDR